MPPPKTAPIKVWKILGAGVLVCLILFGVILTSVVYTVSNWRDNHRTVATAKPRHIQFTRLAEPGSEPSSSSRQSTKNAILAFKDNGKSLPGDDIFKALAIPSLQITVQRQGISGLNRSPRKYVTATIQEGAVTYTNVAIRLKGGPGSFRSLNDLPAFTVNFDKFAPGQKFHGLKKIHLNNSVQDSSYLEEKISRELFEAAGVPVPRAGNAIVTFNERELGLYVLVEGINKQFLKRYFADTTGSIYDGHSQSDVTDDLPVNSGDTPRDRSRLHALAAAARQQDFDTRLEALKKTLDVDRFLTFVAMEAILWHWDGYTMNRNNYRVFHDRETDRMVFIPHGMDQMLSKPHGSIIPPTAGLVSRAVLEIPSLRRQYRERVAQLSTNIFKAGSITDRIHEVSEKIEAVLDDSSAEAHRHRAANLSRKVEQRAHFLEAQITPEKPLEFGDRGVAPLTNWQTRRDLGDALLDREQDADGKTVLHISSKEGCTASWRTTQLLDAGKYRFEARLKTRGVVLNRDDPRAGAGLRISRHRVGQKNSGDKDWTPVVFEFDVPEDQTDTELVCELRADRGDVWFDLSSLKLQRK